MNGRLSPARTKSSSAQVIHTGKWTRSGASGPNQNADQPFATLKTQPRLWSAAVARAQGVTVRASVFGAPDGHPFTADNDTFACLNDLQCSAPRASVRCTSVELKLGTDLGSAKRAGKAGILIRRSSSCSTSSLGMRRTTSSPVRITQHYVKRGGRTSL